jgi:hypothetical protein
MSWWLAGPIIAVLSIGNYVLKPECAGTFSVRDFLAYMCIFMAGVVSTMPGKSSVDGLNKR